MSSGHNNPSDETVDSFCAVTGASAERARFFLDSANGDLTMAIESFFENGGTEMEGGDNEPPARQFTNPIGHDDDDQDDEDDGEADEALEKFMAAHAKRGEKKKSGPTTRSSTNPASRIHTISSFNQNEEDRDEDDDDDEEKGQAFYAGGSSTSGQQILGPSKKKNPEALIKNLFQKAKDHGAEEVNPSEQSSDGSASTSYSNGYRLGTGNEPTEVIPGAAKPNKPKVCILKLWKNGFNVDDGALRDYSKPENQEFLKDIQSGRPPRELIRQANGSEVHLDMQDHRDEEYEPPKGQYRLYNDGYKLGSTSTASVAVESTASSADKATNEEKARRAMNVDDSKPVTQIQIRLADGSRLILKANHAHTVADIRNFINNSRPEYCQHAYALLTSFPNKELTNDSETLQQGNLLNAVIIQKMK